MIINVQKPIRSELGSNFEIMKTETEKIRIDKYLWSIRIFKTRALATKGCEDGKVKLGGLAIKASRAIKLGDEYEIRTSDRKWTIRVTALLDHRVAFSEAIKHYEDLTPPEEKERQQMIAAVFHTGKRMSKQGRPTKKNKRDLDEFMDQ
jgi:ribosome-associated heat shock protein Hsp15